MIWLLDLTWAGRVFRFASEEGIVVLDADGVSLPYAGGLVPDFTLGAAIGDIQDELEVDLGELVFPVDPIEWTRQGRPLIGATAELSTWTEGDTWEERVPRVNGLVSSSTLRPGNAASLTLRWAKTDPVRLVDSEALVSAETWSGVAVSFIGKTYPRIFGTPGLGLSTAVAEEIVVTGGCACPILSSTQLVVAGHPVASTSVTVLKVIGIGDTDTDTLQATFLSGVTVTTESDLLGRSIATATPAFVGTGFTANASYYIDWSGTDGATLKRDGTTAISSFGDMMYWLATESPTVFDGAAWRSVPAQFAAYKVGYFVDDPDVTPTDVITEVCLPLLPLSIIPGPDGLIPVWWNLRATSADAEVDLVAGENVTRVSDSNIDLDGVVNSFEMAFAPRMDDGEPYRTVVVNSETDASCAASVTYFPEVTMRVETQAVYSESTARAMLETMALHKALPVERIVYRDDENLDLRPGTVVTITDTDMHLSSRVAHVASVTYAGATIEYELMIFTLPGRDRLLE